MRRGCLRPTEYGTTSTSVEWRPRNTSWRVVRMDPSSSETATLSREPTFSLLCKLNVQLAVCESKLQLCGGGVFDWSTMFYLSTLYSACFMVIARIVSWRHWHTMFYLSTLYSACFHDNALKLSVGGTALRERKRERNLVTRPQLLFFICSPHIIFKPHSGKHGSALTPNW